MIGLAQAWIFSEPFDVRPVDFANEGTWQVETTEGRADKAIERIVSILKRDSDTDGLGHDIRSRLRKALRQAGRREIGGIIFAERFAPAHFRIMDFSLDAHSGSHATFTRDPEVHRQALDGFFRRTDNNFARYNYLGEWHSHPSFSAHPSQDDIATMTDLVENGEDISFAVLMIVRLRLPSGWIAPLPFLREVRPR